MMPCASDAMQIWRGELMMYERHQRQPTSNRYQLTNEMPEQNPETSESRFMCMYEPY
jgi:hypothetical protein